MQVRAGRSVTMSMLCLFCGVRATGNSKGPAELLLTDGTMYEEQAVDRAVAIQGVGGDEGVRPASPGEGHVETVEGGTLGRPKA